MIFRPNSDGKLNLKAQDGYGWRSSEHYSKEVAAHFQDNADGSSDKVTNSVPSPYARMFLFKQAFEYVVANDLIGESIYHYLVSHCLDVFELLFNKSALPGKVEIIRWNIYEELNTLSHKDNHQGHQLLGNTLRIYREKTPLERFLVSLGTDESEPLNELFFIVIDGKAIAGTSPLTGFFTTENEIPLLNSIFLLKKIAALNQRLCMNGQKNFSATCTDFGEITRLYL